MATENTFLFTEEMIKTALKANGYYTLWNEENWVPPDSTNPDWAGMSLMQAFTMLLRKTNLA